MSQAYSKQLTTLSTAKLVQAGLSSSDKHKRQIKLLLRHQLTETNLLRCNNWERMTKKDHTTKEEKTFGCCENPTLVSWHHEPTLYPSHNSTRAKHSSKGLYNYQDDVWLESGSATLLVPSLWHKMSLKFCFKSNRSRKSLKMFFCSTSWAQINRAL